MNILKYALNYWHTGWQQPYLIHRFLNVKLRAQQVFWLTLKHMLQKDVFGMREDNERFIVETRVGAVLRLKLWKILFGLR